MESISSTPIDTAPTSELPKQYDHAAAQQRWLKHWEDHGYFHAVPNDPARPVPFTIVIPPPNVTGALHLGHALNNTLQDILTRTKRMQGFNALWMPGTDHAGIATQAVVERRILQEEKLSRHDLGREGLVDRIWAWKHEYEARILEQLKQMGCSCDFQRTRFTLDDVCAKAVRHTFFNMFRDGLIYRGKRLVNWDTFLQTAVSDDEVFHETVKGHFWHLKYPIAAQPGNIAPADGKRSSNEPEFVIVATTRPETMLGDTAVAVHPDPAAALDKVEAELKQKLADAAAKDKADIEKQLDELAQRRVNILPGLIKLRDMARAGRMVELPLTGREIPLVCDEWAKPELGSGCVKITPAHDPNDYEVGKRQSLAMINIMTPEGAVNDSAPQAYRGLTMKKARERVVADLESLGLLDHIEDREIEIAHSDRSKTAIEPYLADQWFVKMSDVEDGSAADRSVGNALRGVPKSQDHDASVGNALRGVPEPPNDEATSTSTSATGQDRGRSLQMHTRPGLAQTAMDAVTSGRVQITPARYAKSYLDWLSEKRDWPVSRQLWWGHRIPVWEATTTSGGTVDANYATKERQEQQDAISALSVYLSACGVSKEDFFIQPVESWKIRICSSDEKTNEALRALVVFDKSFEPQLVKPGKPVSEVLRHVPGFEKATYAAFDIKFAHFLTQDPDVLDTWFSSALWPHSTLGWPEQTPELDCFYPTSVLLTSRDIITLWVARMVLTGLYNTGDVPFKQVYIHPKILDGFGETMSKSKGNGVDPLDVIAKFGADSLRFSLSSMATETQDVRMPVEFECPHCEKTIEQTHKNRVLPKIKCPHCNAEFSTQWANTPQDKALPRGAVISERFEVARNFCNKLWNASRFALMNLEGYSSAPVNVPSLPIEDRWVLSRLSTVTAAVTAAIESYKFADAARALYDFAWDEFCSFYVEMIKTRLQEPADRSVAQRVLAYTLDNLLRLLHPMVPFVTEEVWHLLADVAPSRGLATPAAAAESIAIAKWPIADRTQQDQSIEERFAKFQALLGGLREVRARQNIPPKTPIKFAVRCDAPTAELLQPMAPYFSSMAGATPVAWGADVQSPALSANFSAAGCDVFVDLAEHIDVAAEILRNEKELEKIAGFIAAKEKKLSNESFVSRAPADVIAKEREQLAELHARLASTTTALDDLRRRKPV